MQKKGKIYNYFTFYCAKSEKNSNFAHDNPTIRRNEPAKG